MFTENVINCVNNIYNDVKESSSTEVQGALKELEKVLQDNDYEAMVNKAILATMTLSLSQSIMDDQFFESALIQNLDFVLNKIPNMKKSMTIKIELEGLENHINRTMKVPYGMILADLCYLTLASVKAEGSHLFSMSVNNSKYGCDACDSEFIDDYAADIIIPELELKKGSQLQLWYDFGDDYLLNIEVLDIEDHDSIQSLDNIKIIDGTGYGIWEDAHSLLHLYYTNRKEFLLRIKEYGLAEDDFIFEDFDADETYELIKEDFEYLKMVYELSDELDG